ncbi:MAG: HEAT repeat domain-containing protein [Polyangiaceae bacterium]|nr:HEAT repeat domain-containing protein [Polyangiaceae bacterium]MCB9608944.1 HEAT repeat domain-containing protein [Polyangiaceae bacterium]
MANDSNRKWTTQRRAVFAAGALSLALLPSLLLGVDAGAQEGTQRLSPRERVLAQMAKDPAALINVSYGEMPSSPDVLNLGRRGTAALARCLQDNANTDVRSECARLLRALGDRSALPNLRAALADWEPSVRYEVIQALESMPDEESFEPLYKLYQRDDESPSNRMAIVDALGALGSQRAVRVLRSELRKAPKKDETDNRGRVYSALWRSRHLMARQTLIGDVAYVLGLKDNDWLVLQGTESAAELQAKQLVNKLTPLMGHRNEEVRNKAVYALGKIGDPTATRALIGHLPKVREARMLNNIAFALERLDPKAFFPAIEKLAAHKQAVIRLNAAFVLGDVKRPEGLPMLQKSLGDPSDFVRTSAIVALGKLAEPKAIPSLEKFTDDANPTIREEAIYAVNKLSGDKKQDLIYKQLYASKDAERRPQMRERAAVTLGKLGDTRVRNYLLGCFERYQCDLRDIREFASQDKDPRTAGRLLLSWARGRSVLTGLLGDLKPAGGVAVANSAFDEAMAHRAYGNAQRSTLLIADLGDKSSKQRLDTVKGHKQTWIRLYTGVARLRLGESVAVSELMRDYDNLPVDWLDSALNLFATIKEDSARKALQPELEKRSKAPDLEPAMAAAAILLSWDPEQGFFRMLDGLSSKSTEERELAYFYLATDDSKKLTFVMRRALSREQRPFTRDQLRVILDNRG